MIKAIHLRVRVPNRLLVGLAFPTFMAKHIIGDQALLLRQRFDRRGHICVDGMIESLFDEDLVALVQLLARESAPTSRSRPANLEELVREDRQPLLGAVGVLVGCKERQFSRLKKDLRFDLAESIALNC